MGHKSIDVAVIGAGPAGLSTAIYAAKNGQKVTIFEKKNKIGFPSVCGELLPTEQETKKLLPKAESISEVFQAAAEAAVNRCRSIEAFSPLGRSWSFNFDAYVLDRCLFEKLLFEEACRLGVESAIGVQARLLLADKNAYVEGPTGHVVEARVVVAADGFPSRVAVEAGLPVKRYLRPENLAACVQYRMTGVETDNYVAKVYFSSKLAPGGYGWIIPKGKGEANLGVGVRKAALPRAESVKGLLDRLVLEKLGEGSERRRITATVSDVLPVGGALDRTYGGRVVAVGDAAGMVMPTNGGGISTALISGKIAGETTADFLNGKCALSEYERRWRRQLGDELGNSAKLRQVADVFMGNDRVLHWSLLALGEEGIKQVMTCKVPWKVVLLTKLL